MPLTKEILERYLNQVFVETGSNRGDGIQAALDAGFGCIYSTDISPFAHGYCTHRFWDWRDIVFLYGDDSRKFLKWFIPKLTTRCTFWLDAHFCGGEGGHRLDVPLLRELRIIRSSLLNIHTILIDDVRLMGTPDLPVSLRHVMASLKKINPDYITSRIDSPEFKDDILVAEIPPPPLQPEEPCPPPLNNP